MVRILALFAAKLFENEIYSTALLYMVKTIHYKVRLRTGELIIKKLGCLSIKKSPTVHSEIKNRIIQPASF